MISLFYIPHKLKMILHRKTRLAEVQQSLLIMAERAISSLKPEKSSCSKSLLFLILIMFLLFNTIAKMIYINGTAKRFILLQVLRFAMQYREEPQRTTNTKQEKQKTKLSQSNKEIQSCQNQPSPMSQQARLSS